MGADLLSLSQKQQKGNLYVCGFFLSMYYLLRKEEAYAILHCLYWVCVSISAKKHQEWKSFSLKGHVKVMGKESSGSVSKNSGRNFKKYMFCQYQMPSQGP